MTIAPNESIVCAHGVFKYVYNIVIGKRNWFDGCLLCIRQRFGHLYENELHSDIVLLIGEEGYQERVPGHTWVLSHGSDYFRALFESPLAADSKGIHRFPDNPNGFNNLIKWIYQSRCEFQSLQSCLDTLQVSIKYLCPELADQCIKYIITQLSVQNVITVLGWIHCYCTHSDPTAPSLASLESESPPPYSEVQELDPTISCHELLDKCLKLIDENTESVLNTESLCTVDAAVLKLIFQRDTIKIASELVIVRALYAWSTATCKRRGMPLTNLNRIETLGSLRFLARLLTLKPQELQAPIKTELLAITTAEEYNFIVSTVNGKCDQVVPYSMVYYEKIMSTPRQPATKCKQKSKLRKKFKKKEIMYDFVSLLAMIFD